MPSTPEARHRLAELMEARCLELRLHWQDVAKAGHVSVRALHAARTGTAEIRPLTQRGIEDGLRWPPGYMQAVLDGRDPPALAGAEPEPEPLAEPAETVPPGVAFAISALVASLVPAIEVEVRRARMRNPHATGADIFTDPYEAAVWDTELPESRRIGIVAFLRAVRTQREAGNGEPNSSGRAR